MPDHRISGCPMNQHDLIALLRSSASPAGERTPFCADDHDIVAYVDGSLNSHDHQRLERHLADCQVYVGRVGLLTRLVRDANEDDLPAASLIARARAHMHRRPMHSAPKWAAAAVVVLAVISVPNWGPDTDIGVEIDPRTTRAVPSVFASPQVLAPSAGMVITTDSLDFRWGSVPGSLYYNVRIVSDSGDLIAERRINGTEWQASDELNLSPGTEYFIRVDAYMSDAKTISSQHVRFKIKELN